MEETMSIMTRKELIQDWSKDPMYCGAFFGVFLGAIILAILFGFPKVSLIEKAQYFLLIVIGCMTTSAIAMIFGDQLSYRLKYRYLWQRRSIKPCIKRDCDYFCIIYRIIGLPLTLMTGVVFWGGVIEKTHTPLWTIIFALINGLIPTLVISAQGLIKMRKNYQFWLKKKEG
jgi:hypothetical protein